MQAPFSKVVLSKAVWGKAVWSPVVALWLMVPAPAAAQHSDPHSKIDEPLSELSASAGPQRVIVRTKRGAGLHVRRKLQAQGGGVIASHQLVDAMTARVHAADIAVLASDPDVVSISPDARVSPSEGGNKSADSEFQNTVGTPGIRFLALKVLDKRGSGHTSSVIRALEFAVANKDRYGVRVINLSLGHPVYESAATDPLVQAVEAAVRAGIVVVAAAGNCGTNPATGLAGYGGIASPGNAPSAITVGAANTNGTITRTDDRVAGYSSRGPAWYDGIAKPDILAPGQAMISNEVDGSTLALDYPSLIVESGTSKYLQLNGSSMATGVVSGLVAILLEANHWGAYMRWNALQETLRGNQRFDFVAPPPLTPNAIKAMLQYSATPLADDAAVRYDALTQGAGLVNGHGAISLAFHADTRLDAGSFWLTTAVPPVTTFDGADAAWSESVIWGIRLVSGSSIVELNQSAWADNIVWGTGEMDSIVWGTVNDEDNIVWGTAFGLTDVTWFGNMLLGDNIVWGTTDWADNIVWGTGLLGSFDGDNIAWGTNDNKVTVLGSSLVGGGL